MCVLQYVLKAMWIDNVSARDRRNAMQEASLLSKLHHPNIVRCVALLATYPVRPRLGTVVLLPPAYQLKHK